MIHHHFVNTLSSKLRSAKNKSPNLTIFVQNIATMRALKCLIKTEKLYVEIENFNEPVSLFELNDHVSIFNLQ